MGESPYRDIPSIARAASIVRSEIRRCYREMEQAALDFVYSVVSVLDDDLESHSSRHRYRHRYSRSRREYRSDERPGRGRWRSQSNSGTSSRYSWEQNQWSSSNKTANASLRPSDFAHLQGRISQLGTPGPPPVARPPPPVCAPRPLLPLHKFGPAHLPQCSNPINNNYSWNSTWQARAQRSPLLKRDEVYSDINVGNAVRVSDYDLSEQRQRQSHSPSSNRRSRNTHSRSHNTRRNDSSRHSSSSRGHSSSRYSSRYGSSPSSARSSRNSKSYERSKVDRPSKYSSDEHSGGSNTTPYSPGSKRSRDTNTPSSYSHSVSQGRRHNRDRSRDKCKYYKRPRVDSPSSLHSPQGPSNRGGRKTSILSSCGNLSTRSEAACDRPMGSSSREHPGEVMAKDFVPYGSNDELPSVSEASVREMKVASNSITLKHREAKGGAREGNALKDSDLVVSGQSKGREGKGTSNKQASAEGPEVPSVSQDSTCPDRKRSKKHKHSAKDKTDELKAKERKSSSSKEQRGGKSSHTEQQEKATHSPTVVASSSSAKGEYRRANNLQVQTETALGEHKKSTV
ncbi:hypothetical protein XENTR_v10022669 [Xenopus tropicalis]|uniref:Cyclin-dependent kinase 13-like n=1 Tax=Xenopus tropicalis TaxID=8364 RepID=A0A8J1IN81_XENTR|nr:cyclin-dependent kinase 13-like [Xenopus tropicalis]KAE8588654.1 hypothetical protein XENTR_v10022669 [Xenopus tropicalis]